MAELSVFYHIATWSKTGGNSFSSDSDISVAYNRLPIALVEYCKSRRFERFSDLERDFPCVAGRLKSLGENAITVDRVSDLLACEVNVDIQDDSIFMEGLGRAIQEKMPADFHLMNQGRMWSRIGSLGELVLSKSDTSSNDLVIMVRPDLVIHSHDISGLIDKICADLKHPTVIVDRDIHASLLDGVGDRYIIGRLHSILKLFDGPKIFSSILNNDELMSTYAPRLHAHRLIQTILYESGVNIIQATPADINFSIFRGRLKADELIKELEIDSVSSPSLSVRRMAKDLF